MHHFLPRLHTRNLVHWRLFSDVLSTLNLAAHLSTRAASSLRRLTFGPVFAPFAPLLDAPDSGPGGRKIVFALDGSEFSKEALNWALDKVLSKDDSLTLLYVYEFTPVASLDLYGSSTVSEINAELEAKGEEESVKMLKGHGRTCLAAGLKPHLTVLKGPVKHSIVDFVQDDPPDMLLIASRGLGAVKRLFLGSTSDYVVHHCSCPVLVIRNEHTKSS